MNVVVDVRSAPYSRYLPHFNKEVSAQHSLGRRSAFDYAFLGKELGGQPRDRACYDADGRIMYDAASGNRLPSSNGIEYASWRATPPQSCIALTCSEKEPLDCHRTLLISQALAKRGVAPAHIHADGSLGKPCRRHEPAAGRFQVAAQRRPLPFS